LEITALKFDWDEPWLTPLADIGRRVSCTDWRGALNHASKERDLRNFSGKSVVFTAGDAAAGEPYESFIARTGCVPTRDNLHDFFNALILLHFPLSKAKLTQLQAAAISRDGIKPSRGATRDAATLMDENAILLVTHRADLIDAARLHNWPELFVRHRSAWSDQIAARVFGHALLEKLVRPYKAITAHALHVPLTADASSAEVDSYLASTLDDEFSPLQLIPLPVLGIPGWCAENANPEFYLDVKVFRPANMRRPGTAEKQSNETWRT